MIATRSGLEPPPDRDIAKFPILDQIFKDANRDRKAGTPPIAYEIGFFGEGCGRSNDCDQSAKINDQLSKLGEIVRTAGQIDVMFVIDNTQSMDQYFAPIARAVSRWARETSAKRGAGSASARRSTATTRARGLPPSTIWTSGSSLSSTRIPASLRER